MHVLLKVIDGVNEGMTFLLRQGQVARVGRTAWADFCVPGDQALSESHFTLKCDANCCHVAAEENSGEVLVNGEPADAAKLRDGDEITAGSTTFAVAFGGIMVDYHPDGLDEAAAGDDEPPLEPAQDYCAQLKLSDAALELLAGGPSTAEFYDALSDAELFADAVTFLASWLPKPKAVWWGCECVLKTFSDKLSVDQRAAVDASLSWAQEPTEEHRRAAHTAATVIRGKTPAGWLAMATFWAEGSIGPPDTAEVLAEPHLAAQAVAAAVNVTATSRKPVEETRQQFLADGRALIDSDIAPSDTAPNN